MSKSNSFKEIIEKIWPNTKNELEKIIVNAKKMLDKGEGYLKNVSDKSISQTKKISLILLKEKLYYDLGKILSTVSSNRWKTNKKINLLLEKIKSINSEIKKIS